jgi:hypothetical protein
MSVLDTKTPTKDEIETCKWIVLTSDDVWDSKPDKFNEEEEKLEYLDCTLIRIDRDICPLQGY